jgi:hypothetical protein
MDIFRRIHQLFEIVAHSHVIGKIRVRLAASDAPVAVKRRAVNASSSLKSSLYFPFHLNMFCTGERKLTDVTRKPFYFTEINIIARDHVLRQQTCQSL